MVGLDAELVHYGEQQVRHRGVLGVAHVAAAATLSDRGCAGGLSHPCLRRAVCYQGEPCVVGRQWTPGPESEPHSDALSLRLQPAGSILGGQCQSEPVQMEPGTDITFFVKGVNHYDSERDNHKCHDDG